MYCANCHAEISNDSIFCSKCGRPTQPPAAGPDSATHTILLGPEEQPAGTVLAGKYKILHVVGRGGMGIVCKAEDIKLHRHVALKFLPPQLVRNPEARERFVLEARAAAALQHPNICTIHEIHDEGEAPFIAMEFVEGQSLRVRSKDHSLEAAMAVDLAIQVADALDEAHHKGVIHRDIKSANIMVTDKGQAKVMDFGLAKVSGESLHTREGTTLGTVAYMSPEQARGEPVDQRSDIWSLGVVLYEMLSGQLPFAGDRDASILYSVVHEEPKSLAGMHPGVPQELQQIVRRALRKDVQSRYTSAAEMGRELRQYRDNLKAAELSVLTPQAVLRAARKPRVAIPAAVFLVLLSAAGAWFFHRQSKVRWAREQALPEVERIVNTLQVGYTNLGKAYAVAQEAEKYIAGDPTLNRLLQICSVRISIKTEPPGAKVYMKEYSDTTEQWHYLGVTPMEKIRLPDGYFSWKIQKDGYETVTALATTGVYQAYDLFRKLDPQGKVPPGMVRVLGDQTPAGELDDFFIDRYEVTNRQYKQFVDSGGYRDRKYWKHQFVKAGKTLSWEEAMNEFVDQTGRPAPSTWQAADFAQGQEDYPVSGVSWYEAAAYAEYAGKSLPTVQHWALGAGFNTALYAFNSIVPRLSNFKGEGPAPAGKYRSLTSYGAYDMAGNVREWCWNETRDGRILRGGAWDDALYMLSNLSQAPAVDRSPKNGFRCALYIDSARIPQAAFDPVVPPAPTDFYKLQPVAEPVFQVYKDQFAYDKKPLNPHLDWRSQSSGDWVQEKVSVDVPYGNEKLPMYLFLPKNSSPPYQTVIYFPGSGSTYQEFSQDLEHYREFEYNLAFIVKNGRAVVYPIYKGTFERRDPVNIRPIHSGAPTRQYTEYLIQLVKDFKTCIDYLETRPDVDSKKLGFAGFSWGSKMAPILLATEERVRTGVLLIGGLGSNMRPEALGFNYAPRVKIPILMLNGKYDLTFPFDTSAKPLFDMLGTPREHKRQIAYDSDHFLPHNEMIKETLAWLDRYLGPVK